MSAHWREYTHLPFDQQPTLRYRTEEPKHQPVEANPKIIVVEIQPFPTGLMRGFGVGAVIGAVIGLMVGLMLHFGIISIPGWESLYALDGLTLTVFFTLIGAALGGSSIGIVSMLL